MDEKQLLIYMHKLVLPHIKAQIVFLYFAFEQKVPVAEKQINAIVLYSFIHGFDQLQANKFSKFQIPL